MPELSFGLMDVVALTEIAFLQSSGHMSTLSTAHAYTGPAVASLPALASLPLPDVPADFSQRHN